MPQVVKERLMDCNDVAKLLKLHYNTVYKWSRLGVIPSIRMPGGRIRFQPSDIEKFKNERLLGRL